MTYSRRDLSVLLPALAAAQAAAQNKALPSTVRKYEDLTVKTNGQNHSRAMIKGETHKGAAIELHETELAAGAAPHPPHHHTHEEMLMLRDGTLEVTVAGKSEKIGPGSVVYVASGEEHGWRNVGTDRARYFVIAFGAEA